MAAVQGDRDAASNLDILDREGLGWPGGENDPGPSPVSGPVFEPARAPSLKRATGAEPPRAL